MSELVEKVAEMPDLPTRTVQLTGITKSERPDIQFEPAPDPAPAVCVWTASSASGLFSARCQPHNSFVRPVDNCHLCGLPIKFTEAQR